MPIASTDIVLRRAGAAGLGGAKSATSVGSAIFDDVQTADSANGHVDFRCVYAHNAHATLTLQAAVAWISANTPSSSTVIEIGVGTSAINGTEQTIASETTAPTGVTFAPASTKAAGVALGDIPPGQHRAVWFKRTTTAGAAGSPSDTWTARVDGDTL